MRTHFLFGALMIGALALPSAAMADDPKDPEMQSAEARAADREQIRKLNLDMLAQVQARDAGYAAAWKKYAESRANEAQHAEAYRIRMAAYHQEQARYAADRESYEQAMADWRRDVSACRAGDRTACQETRKRHIRRQDWI